MPKMDSGLFGKCDPYLKMTLGDDSKQTKVNPKPYLKMTLGDDTKQTKVNPKP